MGASSDPPPEGLTEEMQQVVSEAIQNMKVEHARWAFSLGVQTQHLMVGIWDAAIEEAYACGHLHELARDEMLARNPYRPKEETSGG